MVECNKIYYYEKKFKKKQNRKKHFIIFVSFFLVTFTIIFYLSSVINPIIMSHGDIESKRLVTISCNEAIAEVTNLVTYDSLITIYYDDNNDISLIKANTEQINILSNILAKKTQDFIDENSKIGFKISVGTLTGIGLLVGRGYKINFSIVPKGSVLCHFYSSFTQAGINQTSHKLFVTIESKCSLILPFKTLNYVVNANFLLTECIIVGKVPNTYLNINS